MKKSKLEHSFDPVRLSDDEKKKILTELNVKKSRKSRQIPWQPVLSLALVAFLVTGTYLSGRFLYNGRQATTTVPDTRTQAGTDSVLGLTTRYPVMVSLFTGKEYPVNLETWDKIVGILNKAVADPGINGMDLDLRENDLEFIGEQGNKLMIRDFREVYLTSAATFRAFHLEPADSDSLKTVLTGVLSQAPLPWPTFSDGYNALRKLTTQTEYPVTAADWTKIVALLNQAVRDPGITGVTDDLLQDDLELLDDQGSRIFIREFRRIYLLGADGTFAAYHLSEEAGQALQSLLSQVMTRATQNVKETLRNILNSEKAAMTLRQYPGEPLPANYQAIDLSYLNQLLEAELTPSQKPAELPQGIVLLEAVGQGLGIFKDTLYVLSGDDITSFDLKLPDLKPQALAEDLEAQYDSLLRLIAKTSAASPQELNYTRFKGSADQTPLTLSPQDWDDLYVILKTSTYVEPLPASGLDEAGLGRILTDDPEIYTLFSPGGDLYVLNKGSKPEARFKLSVEMALKFQELLQLIRERQ